MGQKRTGDAHATAAAESTNLIAEVVENDGEGGTVNLRIGCFNIRREQHGKVHINTGSWCEVRDSPICSQFLVLDEGMVILHFSNCSWVFQ